MDHGRFRFSPIGARPRFELPGGARVGVWVIPNIEHFQFDKPGPSATGVTAAFKPDVLNSAWRDYGNRVGVWRMFDVLERHGVKGTCALNSDACEEYPQIIEAANQMGYEWMGHGENNSVLLTGVGEKEEQQLIARAISRITEGTGQRPRGWLGPALTETANTPDILAEQGIEYVCDWANDELPYELTVKRGKLLSVPYTIEMNDIFAFMERRLTAETFCQMIIDQFDVLYEEGTKSPRLMAISLHPFLIGHPYRSKYLDKALTHLKRREQVWWTTGSGIVDWYRAGG